MNLSIYLTRIKTKSLDRYKAINGYASPTQDTQFIYLKARKYARVMKAPLVFCSTAESINVQKIYKIVLAKVFDLNCTLPEISEIGGPIIEYKHC